MSAPYSLRFLLAGAALTAATIHALPAQKPAPAIAAAAKVLHRTVKVGDLDIF